MARGVKKQPAGNKRKSPARRKKKRPAQRLSGALSAEVLDALAVGYLARSVSKREQARHCVLMHFPDSGSTTKPSDRFSRRTWRDRANSIATCVLHIPGVRPVPHEEVVVLLDSNFDSTRNDLLVALYAKLGV